MTKKSAAKYKCQMWLGTEDGYSQYVDLLESKTADPSALYGEEEKTSAETDEVFGDMDYMMQLVNGTAVISISGPMDNDYSPYNKYYGIVSYPEIRAAVAEAVNHGEVSAILLDIDSPGGAVNGLSEVSDFIRNVDENHKPVYTNTSATMVSGGYWLGSNGRNITATELSTVGSIGVIAVHREVTEMLKNRGINTTVIREGKYKALANPYEKLTPEAKEEIQKELVTIYDVFTRTVAENRGMTQQYVQDNAAEGRTFFGREAIEVGLVDTLGTFDDALAMIERVKASAEHNTHNQAEVLDMPRKKRVISSTDQAVLAAGGQVAATEPETKGADNASGDGTDSDSTGVTETAAAAVTEPEKSGDEAVAAAEAGAGSTDGKAAGTDEKAAAETAQAAEATALVNQLAKVNDQLVDLKVQVKQLEASAETADSNVSALTAIAVTSAQRLQVATGGTATSFEGVGVPALVAQFEALNAAFLERFPVGAKAEVPTESDSQTPQTVSQLDVARNNATRFSKSK